MVKSNSNPLRAAKLPTNGDGNSILNTILRSVPPEELEKVLPKLEFVQLTLHQVLYDAGQIIKSGYFLNEGMISILSVQPDGKSVEVGLIGSEGFVGLPVLVGYRTSPTRLIVQGDGSAYRCDAAALRQLVRQCPDLDQQLQRFGQRLTMQTTQIAACNRLHEVEERLARWILMTQDRVRSDRLPLTQEFLGQMLGTRRSSVTVAAGVLQRRKLIEYTRGAVEIVNRKKLENSACECYGVIRQYDGELGLK